MTTAGTNPAWQPYREPFRTTLLRTCTIALAVGGVLALTSHRLSRWPILSLLMLWPALGGHFVEIFFLNVLRPQLPAARGVQVMARLVLWFAGGVVLMLAIEATASAIGYTPLRHVEWWIGGIAFIGIELVAHLVLQMRRRGSLYNGRG